MAVTVKLNALPAVAVAGADTVKWVAGPVTTMGSLVPVIDDVTVSVAVMVWLPLVFRVAEKLPVPFVKVDGGGKTATKSVEVNLTTPG